jgi:nucleotide-binding universal stress UspA family protein
LGVRLDTLIASGSRPENAIVVTAERGRFDLVLVGVQLRPAEQRLYFGPKVEYLLRNARCALAVVVMPELSAQGRS